MYLIVEGEVQKIKRNKPQAARRVSRINMTAFNIESSSIVNKLNTKGSHHALNNLDLKSL